MLSNILQGCYWRRRQGDIDICRRAAWGTYVLSDLDWSRAQALPANFVGRALAQRNGDCVWRIPRRGGGDDLYILLLLEHQSSPDPHMALRILVYVGLLHQSLIQQGRMPAGGRYPPVLPVVLYSGTAP